MRPLAVPSVGCLAGLLLLGTGCASAPDGPPPESCLTPAFAGAPLGVRCNQLVDQQGRTVLLHGANGHFRGLRDIMLDDGSLTTTQVPFYSPEDPAQMRAVGFNALRFTVNWGSIEPTEDGGLDPAKLDQIATIVDACRQAGVYVLIDLHQDGYSKYLGEDGAPKWAIRPPAPAQHYMGPDQNVTGPVLAAFDTFFGNTADGQWLRQRYAQMLTQLATRFAHDDRVIGFELMNEPISTEELLVRFDAEMIAALRPVIPDKLIFFEPSGIRNQIDNSMPGTASLGAGTVYSPHVYTGVFNHNGNWPITKEFLRDSNRGARDEANGYFAPLLVTEWGYGPGDPRFANFVRWEQELQDEYLFGSLFWIWKDYGGPTDWGLVGADPATDLDVKKPDVIAAFSRVRLEAAAGWLTSVSYDADAKVFEARFLGSDSIRAPNVVSIGATPGFASWDVTCDGKPVSVAVAEPLEIPCSGSGAHLLRVAAR
jgi:endoglycosylceramidase